MRGNQLFIPRLLIAGAGSGSGKTTVACGLLAEIRRRGLRPAAFKTGPDYIDPGHLARAGGRAVHNLDPWMLDSETMAGFFAEEARGADIALVEGAMGLYDGEPHSSAEIAKLLGLPVVLMLNARSIGESAAAVALGFREYDRGVDLRGVILNGLGSDSHQERIAAALEKTGILLLGALRRDEENLSLPERHLGLLPAGETENFDEYLERVRSAVAAQVNVDALLTLARFAPPLQAPLLKKPSSVVSGLRVALARDEAFSFYYPESLTTLEALGAELVPFSPLRDASLPPDVRGLILGGGFPEVFAAQLQANTPLRQNIARKAKTGLPILAECGGLMFLCRSISNFDGQTFDMTNIIPATCCMELRLQRVGYVRATALRDTPLGSRGTELKGHEFHFSVMLPDNPANFPWAFRFEGRGAAWTGGYAQGNILASYLHLNFLGSSGAAEAFLKRCATWQS